MWSWSLVTVSGPLLGRDLGGAGDGRGGVEADGGDSLGYSHHMQLPARDKPGPSWSGYLRCTELHRHKQPNTLCVHLPGCAVQRCCI